jgi:hypothetical protein
MEVEVMNAIGSDGIRGRNHADNPLVTYIHETALTLYDPSDAYAPEASHDRVPKRFRKNAPIPRAQVLHRADLVPADIETIHGVQVTDPLRTINNLLVEGFISKDLILQAMREGLRRGSITRSAIRETGFCFLPSAHIELVDTQNSVRITRTRLVSFAFN